MYNNINTYPNHHLPLKSLIQMTFLLCMVSLTLRVFGFKQTFQFLCRFCQSKHNGLKNNDSALDTAKTVSQLVLYTNRTWSFYKALCLTESMVIWWLLCRKGVRAELKLGVRTITGLFESHAWVEYNGTVLNDIKNINHIFSPFDLQSITLENESS